MRVTCPCGATWTAGTGAQHCPNCHQTFVNVTVSDGHRTTDGVCLTPDQMRDLGWSQNNEGAVGPMNHGTATATVIRGNARHLVKEMPAKSLIGIPWRYILRTWEERRQP